MALSASEKAAIVKEYQQAEGDTGSPEVQVALLTININKLHVIPTESSKHISIGTRSRDPVASRRTNTPW